MDRQTANTGNPAAALSPLELTGRARTHVRMVARFGYSEAELRNSVANAGFVRLMQFEVQRTRELFERGAALGKLVEGGGAADVDLFNRCGLALLDAIERRGYDVLHRRVTVSKPRKLLIALRWAFQGFKVLKV